MPSLSFIKQAPLPGSHVLSKDQHNMKKGHPRNICVKLFANQASTFEQEDFFLKVFTIHISEKQAPFPGGHVFQQIKI